MLQGDLYSFTRYVSQKPRDLDTYLQSLSTVVWSLLRLLIYRFNPVMPASVHCMDP